MEAYAIMDEILHLNRGSGVVVDTESGRDKDVSFGRDDGLFGRVLCIGIGPTDVSHEHHVYVFADSCFGIDEVTGDDLTFINKRKMVDLLCKCGVIAQNGKYDAGVLMSFLDHDVPFPLVDDTMLASYACYEVRGIHGLEYMGQELLGSPDWKDEVKEYINKEEGYGAIPRHILNRYNAYDVHATRLLKSYFRNLISSKGLDEFYSWLIGTVSPMLTIVERNGMGWDHERSKEIEADLTEQIDHLEELLPFNPRSWQQVMAYLLDHGIRTDSTDEDHLKVILEQPDHKVKPEVKDTIKLVLDVRALSKKRGTYVTGPDEKATQDGRVHTTYLIHGN